MTWKSIGLALVAVAAAMPGGRARAQSSPAEAAPDSAWNTPRALRLVERARERREEPRSDSGLQNYRAQANGYVYFYLDRRDTNQRTLVKVDQIALDVFWATPNLTKQEIVGMRDANRLPNKMYYHLDHLTVVQDEFGDVIRLGDGDEVRAVPHPVAPGADTVYQFRVADSLTLRIPGAREPVRVYELSVRPRRVDRPAFIGSLYVDQSTGAIVRMTFTFTPASYVDKRLDYINISLENALFEGHYWLPHEQRVEIRRQIPQLDFPAGAVIRGVFRIGDYAFNKPLPPGLFYGARVEAAPATERKAYPFKEGLYADLNEEGLEPPPDMATLRAQAARLVKEHYLSGLPRLRLHMGGASSALRYDRAEGLFLGGGIEYAPSTSSRLHASLGYATAAEKLSASAGARLPLGSATTVRLDAYGHELRDLFPGAMVAGALNTLSAAFLGTDYLDPYYASGGVASIEHALGGGPWSTALRLTLEDERSARLADPTPVLGSGEFRPVRAIEPGRMASARLSLRHGGDANAPVSWDGELALEGGALESHAFARPTLDATALLRSADHETELRVRGLAGIGLGELPPQRLFTFGGAGTLPGYPARAFGGDRFAVVRAEAARDLWAPWVRLRAVAAAGWSDFGSTDQPMDWDVTGTGSLRTSAGLGLGLGWDVLRVDLVRGLSRGGKWQVLFSVSPVLGDIL